MSIGIGDCAIKCIYIYFIPRKLEVVWTILNNYLTVKLASDGSLFCCHLQKWIKHVSTTKKILLSQKIFSGSFPIKVWYLVMELNYYDIGWILTTFLKKREACILSSRLRTVYIDREREKFYLMDSVRKAFSENFQCRKSWIESLPSP